MDLLSRHRQHCVSSDQAAPASDVQFQQESMSSTHWILLQSDDRYHTVAATMDFFDHRGWYAQHTAVCMHTLNVWETRQPLNRPLGNADLPKPRYS